MSVRRFTDRYPNLASGTYIDDTAQVIGDVILGPDVSVWPMCVLRGDVNRIEVGARTNIQDGTVLHGTHDSEFNPGGYGVRVGEEVTIGHRAILHGCSVGDRCLIGMGSIVMDGAVLQPEVILGAGSLVTSGKELESGYLWVGSPARRVRRLTRDELSYLSYSASYYMQLKDRYQADEQ